MRPSFRILPLVLTLFFGPSSFAENLSLLLPHDQISITRRQQDGSLAISIPYFNRYSFPVKVASITPSCDCVVVSAFDNVIAPGKKGNFRATVPSRRVADSVGYQVAIQTDDPPAAGEIIYVDVKLDMPLMIRTKNLLWDKERAFAVQSLKISTARGFKVEDLRILQEPKNFNSSVYRSSIQNWVLIVSPKIGSKSADIRDLLVLRCQYGPQLLEDIPIGLYIL